MQQPFLCKILSFRHTRCRHAAYIHCDTAYSSMDVFRQSQGGDAMENNFNTPKESAQIKISEAQSKAVMPFLKLIILALLGGAFIALGAACSSTAAFAVSNVGLARLISGCVFPVGLILIVVCGGELFTGNCLMSIGLLNKKIKVKGLVRNLVIVWVFNFSGAVLIALLVFLSGNLNYSDGALAAYTIKVAMGKVNLGFGTAFCSGILCNMLVCLAVYGAGAAKDIGGKILAVFFPVCAFVTAGFEHCVANMYYIPAGIFAAMNSEYAAKAMELYGYTSADLAALNFAHMFSNIIPVTLGNMVGGGICIGAAYYLAFIRERK